LTGSESGCPKKSPSASYTRVPQATPAYRLRRRLILLANYAKLFSAPEGRRKLAGGGARAQPPGQVQEDCSRPGKDAGLEFATGSIPVRRHFRARGPVVPFPAATLRSGAG